VGGNVTGLSILSPELDGKRQDILIEAVPGARKIATLADAKNTAPGHLQQMQEAARGRGIELLVRTVGRREDVVSAIDEVKASSAQAINFLATPMFSINAADFITHVTSLRLPSIYQWPEDAEQGALLAYGPRFAEIYRHRARILVKVLRGARPADIPVEQPTKFELVINYLDFEKPVAELDSKVDELRALAATGSDIGDEISRIEDKARRR
jgi:putative ABC transport system substrate-binding protein